VIHKAFSKLSPNKLIAFAVILSIAFLLSIFGTIQFPHTSYSVDYWNWLFWTSIAKSSKCSLDLIIPNAGQGSLSFPLCYSLNPSYWIAQFFPPNLEDSVARLTTLSLTIVALYIAVKALKLSSKVAFLNLILYLIFLSPHNLYYITFGGIKAPNSFFIFEHLNPIHSLLPFSLTYVTLLVFAFNHRRYSLYASIGVVLITWWAFLINPLYSIIYFAYPTVFAAVYSFSSKPTLKIKKSIQNLSIILISFIITGFPIYIAKFILIARSLFGSEVYTAIQTFGVLNSSFLNGSFTVSAILVATVVPIIYLYCIRKDAEIVKPVFVTLAFSMILGIFYTFSGIRWKYPLPIYLEQSMWPLWFLPLSIVICDLINRESLKNSLPKKYLFYSLPFLGIFLTLAALKTKSLNSLSSDIVCALSSQGARCGSTKSVLNSSTSPVFEKLSELKISSSSPAYKGSVASIIGIPGSKIGALLGYKNKLIPFDQNLIDLVPGFVQKNYGIDPSLSAYWRKGIPTTEDNNHMVSPFKYFFFSRLLTRPQDYHPRNWLLVTNPRIPILELIGTKYLLTDSIETGLGSNDLVDSVPDSPLKLYRLNNTNLGNYFPTKMHCHAGYRETLQAMVEETNFASNVYASSGFHCDHSVFVPGKTLEYSFPKAGFVRVKAESLGRSIIVLPLEYRNNFKISGPGNYQALRVNLFMTGIIFNRFLDIEIRTNGPFDYVSTLRARSDAKLISLEQNPDKYPPGYQPYSFEKLIQRFKLFVGLKN